VFGRKTESRGVKKLHTKSGVRKRKGIGCIAIGG
jgi:hypothetical protein